MPDVIPAWPVDLPVPLRSSSRRQHLPKGQRVFFETGRMRQRRMSVTPLKVLHAEWNFTEDQFDTFKTFFEEDLVNGTLSFSIELTEGVESEVLFIDAQYSFARSDNLYSVQSALEIKPDPAPTTFGFDYWLEGVPVPTLVHEVGFGSWIDGSPFIDQ